MYFTLQKTCKDSGGRAHAGRRTLVALLLSAATLPYMGAPVAAEPGELRIMTLNTWNDRFRNWADPADAIGEFFVNGNYDVIALQELYANSSYLPAITRSLSEAGVGDYTTRQIGDLGVVSRLAGATGSYDNGVRIAYQNVEAGNKTPETTIGSIHLDYRDEPGTRVGQAKALNAWAQALGRPAIVTGDFNAGDVSERGLHNGPQQARIFAGAVVNPGGMSALWRQLAREYIPEARAAEFDAYLNEMQSINPATGYRGLSSVIQNYFDSHRDEFPGIGDTSQMTWAQWEDIVVKDMAGRGLTFEPETYPVASNAPVTMNVLKKQFMLLQTEGERERFAPHALDDGSTTWPSAPEDATNTWKSWDRVKIDHFLGSRPFGKWQVIADDPSDPYLGVMDTVDTATDGTPLSDHEALAHVIKWVGPALETYQGADGNDATRLTWGEAAAVFGENDKVFYLSRNNMRNDMYLGQISDENGNPLYALPESSRVTQEQLGVLLGEAVYDRHDTSAFLAQLTRYVPAAEAQAFEAMIADLTDSTSPTYFRNVIQTYLTENPGRFPGKGVSDMSWEEWGVVLMDYAADKVAFSEVDERLADSLAELKAAIGFDDPAVRADLATKYGLDFEKDPNAIFKIPLQCDNAGMMGLQSVRDYCIDDHSFIGETLITDGGTVIVDEDLALGTSAAQLRLDNGSLRIAGTAMTTLGRDISVEAGSGRIDIAAAGHNVTATGVISGSGDFSKAGLGTLTLAADNSFSGNARVDAGRLHVTGSLAGAGLTTVGDGAMISGTGTVGALAIAKGGKLNAGGLTAQDAIGTLTVAGDLSFAEGAVFEIDTNAEGRADKVHATGKATLNGSVFALAASGDYRPMTGYTVLSADQGLSGSFGAVQSSLAFLDAKLSYGERDVTLSLARNDITFDHVGTTANRRAAAAAAETLGVGNEVFDAILSTDAGTADRIYDGLSGEVHASGAGVFTANALVISDAITGRARIAAAAPAADVMSFVAQDAPASRVWQQAYGSWSENDTSGTNKIDSSNGGFVLGTDTAVGNAGYVGAFAGMGSGSVKQANGGARLDADSVHLGLYGGTSLGATDLSLGFAYTRNSVDSLRHVTIGTPQTLTAGYDSDVMQIFGEAARRFETETGSYTPYLGLAWVHQSADAFSESGGSAALSADKIKLDTGFVTLGLRNETAFTLGRSQALFQGEIGLRTAFGDTDPVAQLGFVSGGPGFDVTGAAISDLSGIVKAGVAVSLSPNASIAAGYSGQFSEDGNNHALSADLRISF